MFSGTFNLVQSQSQSHGFLAARDWVMPLNHVFGNSLSAAAWWTGVCRSVLEEPAVQCDDNFTSTRWQGPPGSHGGLPHPGVFACRPVLQHRHHALQGSDLFIMYYINRTKVHEKLCKNHKKRKKNIKKTKKHLVYIVHNRLYIWPRKPRTVLPTGAAWPSLISMHSNNKISLVHLMVTADDKVCKLIFFLI